MREHGVAAGDISGRFDASTVLHWIVRKRTSFIAMASEIGNLLTTLEASIHGNIDFVAFPVKGVDLKIPFGPQVRALLVAAHDASLSDSFIELSKKIELLAEAVHQFSSSCRPQSVIRDTGYGRKARELSRASHGTPEGFRYGMTADLLARRKREYSPVDACLLDDLKIRLDHFMSSVAERSWSDHLNEALEKLRRAYLMNVESLGAARARQSREWPYAHARLSKDILQRIIQKADEAETALQSFSKFEDVSGTLFEAMALSLWKQRWRVYEVWLLCHVCRVLTELSDSFDIADRVQDGVWMLKFTRDDAPVIAFQFPNAALDVYYQYFMRGAGRGNMPDVAVRIRATRAWVFILDPKSGKTFSKRNLAEVCTRYAIAFQPQLSAVANYFWDTFDRQQLMHQTDAVVYCGLRPDTVAAMDQDLIAALENVDVTPTAAQVAVLFDVSGSTESFHGLLDSALRQAIERSRVDRSASMVNFFASNCVEHVQVKQYMMESSRHAGQGGTDYRTAFDEGFRQLALSHRKRELWLIGDGRGSFNWTEASDRCIELAIVFHAFIADAIVHDAIKTLCDSTGGRYTQLNF